MENPSHKKRSSKTFSKPSINKASTEKSKKNTPKTGAKLHPRNKHTGRYNLPQLAETCPELKPYITQNVRGEDTIDFASAEAVKMLNSALLKQHYNIDYWDIPEGYLCPPIPGRADYIHYMADILAGSYFGKQPKGEKITCLDIGVGANCIYPILGVSEYGWNFIGSEIDPKAVESAKVIVDKNKGLKNKVTLKLQPDTKDIFYGVLTHDQKIDLTFCNPPFHASQQAAEEGTLRKLSNLKKQKITEAKLNFGGKGGELWCEGGERRFISNMIRESKKFGKSVFWFSTLVSKASNLKALQDSLDYNKATEIKTVAMSQGNKSSRLLVWTFLTSEEQKEWRKNWDA